jgi:hypothetical protein
MMPLSKAEIKAKTSSFTKSRYWTIRRKKLTDRVTRYNASYESGDRILQSKLCSHPRRPLTPGAPSDLDKPSGPGPVLKSIGVYSLVNVDYVKCKYFFCLVQCWALGAEPSIWRLL